jgi:hypothetical protein
VKGIEEMISYWAEQAQKTHEAAMTPEEREARIAYCAHMIKALTPLVDYPPLLPVAK